MKSQNHTNNKTPSSQTAGAASSVTTFKVSGMDCSDEVSAIEQAFKIEGVLRVDANIMTESVTIYHDETCSVNDFQSMIMKTGVKVVSIPPTSFFKEQSKRIYQVGASGVLLGVGLLLDWTNLSASWVINFAFFASMIFSGFIIFPKAWRSLKAFHLDMNVLMTVAVIGAVLIKQVSEAASVVFLFSLAELLEAMSVARARRAIKDVLKVAPKEAALLDESGNTTQVSVESLKIGNLIVVRPGESIPVDGLIEDGTSSINQASLTGESIAVSKSMGETVWAGTLNESGALKIKVTKLFSETKIAKVIELIENAQAQKAPSQRFVDKFSSIYTPAVLILAVFVAIMPPLFWSLSWEEWIYKALVLLVIGCPCALVIATPVSVVSGLTSLARLGVLVKGGKHLESLGKLKAIALDKTGTITLGEPEVHEIKLFSDYSEQKTLEITASLENMSTHPLAKAVLKYAQDRHIKISPSKNFVNIAGKGAEGLIDGQTYFVGNHTLAHELGVCTPEIETYLDSVETKAMSVIILGHKSQDRTKANIIAIFSVGDQIRPSMKNVVTDLHNAGVQMVAILSGDNQKTVNAISRQVGIDYAKGSLLPEDKVIEVEQLIKRYQYVGMIGDGVNDAPALATATIGIAMGVVGSDTAIETADVALMKDDIGELPNTIAHAKRVVRVIKFNIFFAILIKAVFFVLAFLGLTNLWMAVAADMGASLFVTFNALRLLRVNRHKVL